VVRSRRNYRRGFALGRRPDVSPVELSFDSSFNCPFIDFHPRIIAQLLSPTQDSDGSVHGRHYASLSWNDLWAIAPWMDERISKRIDGAGLGN